MVLNFDEDGLLPEGDYPMTIAELRDSLLVYGPGKTCPQWDSKWRLQLVNNLGHLANQLWAVGITNLFIDGSFVEDKDHPKDIDGYFETTTYRVASGQLQDDLNAIERIWTWSSNAKRPHRESKRRNCRCGTSTASICGRSTRAPVAAYAMRSETTYQSLLHFASLVGKTGQED